MEVYRTEQEQIEAIKKFFSTYGNALLVMVALSIALFVGYHFWLNQQQSDAGEASVYYNELRQMTGSGAVVDAKSREKFDATFANLMTAHSDSIYASYASLLKAKLHVEAGEMDKAVQALQWVIDAAASAEIVALANLRLARVLFAQDQHQKALAALDKDPAGFVAAYEELRGDIHVDLNQPEKALEAYKKAKALRADDAATTSRILDMKIDSLSPGDASKLATLPAEASVPEVAPAPAAPSENP